MEIIVRNDKVEIDGYVNAIERNSKPLRSRIGEFVERICKGAFDKSLKRNADVQILLNHDKSRNLGSIKKGNLELREDNIGLRAKTVIEDADVVEKARKGELVGWSFGFRDVDVEKREENGMPLRLVKDLDLVEVSILDKTRTPAYDGTLIMARDNDIQFYGEALIDEINIREYADNAEAEEDNATPDETQSQQEEHPDEIDYSEYEKMIEDMKGEK